MTKVGRAMREFVKHEQSRRVRLAQPSSRAARRGSNGVSAFLSRPLPSRRALRDPLTAENMRRIRAHEPTIRRVSK